MFLIIKVFFKLKCVHFLSFFFFFSHHAIAPSTDYSIVVMFITCMCIGNPKIHVTRFIVILALLQSSRTELAMSLRSAWIDAGKIMKMVVWMIEPGEPCPHPFISVHSLFTLAKMQTHMTPPAAL